MTLIPAVGNLVVGTCVGTRVSVGAAEAVGTPVGIASFELLDFLLVLG